MKFVTKLLIIVLAIASITARSKTKDVVQYTKNTPSNDAGSGKVAYLDRHNVACPDGSAINYFQYMRDGGNKMHYKYRCVAHKSITTQKVQKKTGLNSKNGDGGATNYLDRHRVDCGAGYALQQFQLKTINGKIEYHYTCAKAKLGTCWDKHTAWQLGGKHYETYYLDRIRDLWAPRPDKEVITGFHLRTSYNNGWFSSYNVKYQYWHRVCELLKPDQKLQATENKPAKYNTYERDSNARRRRF